MRKLLGVIALCMIVGLFSCKESENTWEIYETWRNDNNAWFWQKAEEKGENGKLAYEKIYPTWDPTVYILRKMHKQAITDPALRDTPYITSTVEIKYKGALYNGVGFDSTYLRTDSVARGRVNGYIEGFMVALTNMSVGDSCTVIIPQNLAYGTQMYGSILPYSALTFDLYLKSIPAKEKPNSNF